MIPLSNLRLSDVMDRHIFSVTPECTLGSMVERMKLEPVSHVVVLDDHKAVGMLTERDLVRLLHQRFDRSRPVREFMSVPLAIVPGDLGFRSAYIQLCLSRLRHLVVVDTDGALIGVAAERDFLGQLGMELFQSVRSLRDVIDRSVPQLPPTLPVAEAVDLMIHEKRGCVVVTEGNRFVGLFNEQQIPSVLARHDDGSPVPLGEVMLTAVAPLTETASIAEVMEQMVAERIGHVAVVDIDERVIGTVAQTRLLENVRTAVYAEMATRQLVEDQLLQVESQLEATLEHTPNVAVQWYDCDGAVHYWNHASETIYGWTAVEAVGKTLDQLMLPAKEFGKFKGMLAEIESTGKTVGPIEHSMRHRDGSQRWVESTLFPIPGDNPDESFFVCMDVDISERKQVESQLRERESNLKTFFDTIDDFLFVLDEQGSMQRINRTVVERLGYPEAELLGHNVLHVHPVDRHAEAMQIVADMLAGKGDFCTVPLQTANGQLIPVETRVVAGRWNGQAAIFGVSRDVSERKQAEDARREAEVRQHEQLDELRRWQGVMLDREDRILDLKREVNELLDRLGEGPRYGSAAGGKDNP